MEPLLTDSELVKLSLSNPDSFGILVDRYAEKLCRYIRRISNVNKEDAEDILQNALIKAYKNLNDYDETYKFSTWLYRICHNEVISHIRKTKSGVHGRQLLDANDNDENNSVVMNIASDIDYENSALRELALEQIQSGMNRLSDNYREVLVLRYFEGLDYSEISDILKTTTGNVGSLINRGLAKLKVIINEKTK